MATAQTSIRTRSAAFIAVMSIVTLGIYCPIWIARSWAEMRRTGKVKMIHPVFHVLGLFVPVVSVYRMWRHARAANALGLAADDPVGFPAWIAVLTSMAAGAFTGMALSASGAVAAGLSAVGLILAICVIVRLQSLLNRYAASDFTSPPSLIAFQGGAVRFVLARIGSDGDRREVDVTALFAA